MRRRNLFESIMALVTLSSLSEEMQAATPELKASPNTLMPVLFIGHGSPMNAVEDNDFTQHLVRLGKSLPTPRAVLVISAHWVSQQTALTGHARPKTIHDFSGFPQALYDIQYPCPGDNRLVRNISQNMQHSVSIGVDEQRGLDHGAWTVLHHMYPDANIPVIQLSISSQLSMSEHTRLGADLRKLRREGVLILGSGNIVHNLYKIDRQAGSKPLEWAQEFDDMIKTALEQRNFSSLQAQDHSRLALWRLAHPTLEHYLPLLYVVGASKSSDTLSFPFEGFQAGSLSMRSVLFG